MSRRRARGYAEEPDRLLKQQHTETETAQPAMQQPTIQRYIAALGNQRMGALQRQMMASEVGHGSAFLQRMLAQPQTAGPALQRFFGEGAVNWIEDTVSDAEQTGSEVAAWLGQQAEEGADIAEDTIEWASENSETVSDWVEETDGEVMSWVSATEGEALEWLDQTDGELLDWMKDQESEVAGGLMQAVGLLTEHNSNIGEKALDVIEQISDQGGEGLEMFSKVLSDITDQGGGALEKITALLERLTGLDGHTTDRVFSIIYRIQQYANSLLDRAINIFVNASSRGADYVNRLIGILEQAMSRGSEYFTEVLRALEQGATLDEETLLPQQ